MDVRILPKGGQVSGAQASILDSLVIVIFVPIFDAVIYPLITKFRSGRAPTPIEKVFVGFLFGAGAMFAAGFVEIYRKSVPSIPNSVATSNCASSDNGSTVEMSTASVWLQIPQYILIGIAEILISIPVYDLFFSEVDVSMRGVAQAINLLTTSFGSMVAAGITSIFAFWMPPDLRKGHVEYMFFVLGALSVMNAIAYLLTMYRGFHGSGYPYKSNAYGPLRNEAVPVVAEVHNEVVPGLEEVRA